MKIKEVNKPTSIFFPLEFEEFFFFLSFSWELELKKNGDFEAWRT